MLTCWLSFTLYTVASLLFYKVSNVMQLLVNIEISFGKCVREYFHKYYKLSNVVTQKKTVKLNEIRKLNLLPSGHS